MDIPSLFMIPSAVSSGKVHSVFPNSTDADFQFNRDSDATRVNSEGLIERVGYYGSELVTNGGFDSDSGWNLNTNWTISNGVASCDGTNSNDINQAQNVGVIGKSYRISFTIVSISQGGIAARIGSGVTNYYTEAGTYTEIVTATSTDRIRVSVQGNAIASVDNLSIKEVTGDRARLNYEIEGGLVNTKCSLLLEPQSSNILPYSENFTQWSEFNATNTSNFTSSPDGQITADKITKSGLSGNDRIRKTSISVSNSTSYAISVFVKNDTNVTGGITTLAFRVSGGTLFRQGIEWADNIATLTDTKSNGTRTNKILEDYGNGWYRVGFAFTTDGTSGIFEIDIDRENTNNTTSIFVWGAMLEQQSYATSYIPTNGSTQTRAAESCNNAGTSSILPSEEGIFYAEIAALANDGTVRYLGLSDGSSGNRVVILNDGTTNNIRGIVSSGGTKYVDFAFVVSDVTIFNKVALKWKANDFQLWINGVKRVTDLSGSSPIGLDRLSFDLAGSNTYDGKTRDIRVYNTKEMTDSEVDILLTKITS